jgi:hypothetical protein
MKILDRMKRAKVTRQARKSCALSSLDRTGCKDENFRMFSYAREGRLLLVLLLLSALGVPASRAADTNGPTIHLRYGTNESAANPVADFMYFVPLISRAPVASLTSPGCTQAVHVISSKRRAFGHSFTTTCEIELDGDGRQQSVFDLTPAIRRHESELQKGGSMRRQLKSIDVRGAGAITVEVKGTLSNNIAAVNEVRLRFNPHGHTSPVWIDLCDIHRIDGNDRPTNEIQARVNSLTFRRKAGPPTMEVSVASVKNKDAGDGFWQNVKGGLAGTAVNMFIDPLKIEPAGHEAMLDFGQALESGAPAFTFPLARNLRTNSQ